MVNLSRTAADSISDILHSTQHHYILLSTFYNLLSTYTDKHIAFALNRYHNQNLTTNPYSNLLLPPIGFKKFGKDDEVIFYCRSGRRSGLAFDLARQLGYSGARNYSGSWLDYEAKAKK